MSIMRRAIVVLAMMAAAVCLGAEDAKETLGKDWKIPADKEKFHVFLLMGQSNMAGGIKKHQPGHLLPEDKIPVPHIVHVRTNVASPKKFKWQPSAHPLHVRPGRPNSFGPGIPFAKEYLKDHPGVTVGLLPTAYGGKRIDLLKKGTGLYRGSILKARWAAKQGTLKGVLWHQGESDCFAGDRPDTYEDKLHKLIADVRHDLGMPDLPFVVGDLGQLFGIGENPNPEPERAAGINKVRNALKSVPEKVKHTACVQTTGLTYVDAPKCTHFDRKSYIILGKRYYEAYEKVVERKKQEEKRGEDAERQADTSSQVAGRVPAGRASGVAVPGALRSHETRRRDSRTAGLASPDRPWRRASRGSTADAVAGETGLRVNVDWASFLARHDLVWNAAPTAYSDAPFVGNGILGAMLYQEGTDSLRLDIGRTDVAEHAPEDGSSSVVARKGRLPIGRFVLKVPGGISKWKARLVLHQAETMGHVVTDHGQISFRLFTHATEPVIVLQWELAGEVGAAKPRWIPEAAVVARGSRRSPHRNPGPEISTRDEVNVCVQPRRSGGDYATAWREMRLQDGTRRLFISIADQFPRGSSVGRAVAAVERAAEADFDEFVQTHRAWWRDFYPASFLSIPHPKMESFYWIQMYKLGSCIRKGGPLCDLMGPWYKRSRWPASWWNLNTQMLYWPLPAANRLDMAENLSDALQKNLPNLIANVPEEWRNDSAGISRTTGQDMLERYDSYREKANLVWACHNLWVQYRCSMDEKFLRDQLYPLLRRAVNTYLHQLEKDDKGVYHTPEGHSPESFTGRDTNYDLASVRWGCRTLLRIAERLKIDDDKAGRWGDVIEHLAEYAQDDTGYRGGPGTPAPRGHRHWSHLMMIYPYYEVNWDHVESRDVIRRSVEYWSGARVAHAWSQAVMSSMHSSMGDGDRALRHMERALNSRHLTPNTMHCPGRNPCSETYGGMCQMVHDMLIQSWGDKIRIFPGVPGKWKDAVFHSLRSEGAFVVSAVRSEGKTAWVHVQSLAGEPCVVQADFGGETPNVLAERGVKLTSVGPGVWSVDLKKGESTVLYTGTRVPKLEIAPLAIKAGHSNPYGGRK